MFIIFYCAPCSRRTTPACKTPGWRRPASASSTTPSTRSCSRRFPPRSTCSTVTWSDRAEHSSRYIRTFYVLSCAHMLRVVVSFFVRRSLLTVCMYVRKMLGELVVWMEWGVGRANVVFFGIWGTQTKRRATSVTFDDRYLWSINKLTLSLYVVLTAIHQDSAARFTSGTSFKIRAR